MDDLSGLTRGLGTDSTGGTAAPADPVSALSGLVSAEGGLDGLLGKLRAAGLGDQVDSWIGPGPSQPIEPQQLSAALGKVILKIQQAVEKTARYMMQARQVQHKLRRVGFLDHFVKFFE